MVPILAVWPSLKKASSIHLSFVMKYHRTVSVIATTAINSGMPREPIAEVLDSPRSMAMAWYGVAALKGIQVNVTTRKTKILLPCAEIRLGAEIPRDARSIAR